MSRVSLFITAHIIVAICIGLYLSSFAHVFAQGYVEDGDTILNVSEEGSVDTSTDRASDGIPGGYTSPNSGGGNANNGGGNVNPGPPGELKNPLQSKTIEEFLLKIIDVILVFALPLIILYIMYAGYLFVTARGDTGQIETARTALLWSVVGGVIVLGARLIISVIQGTIQAF